MVGTQRRGSGGEKVDAPAGAVIRAILSVIVVKTALPLEQMEVGSSPWWGRGRRVELSVVEDCIRCSCCCGGRGARRNI